MQAKSKKIISKNKLFAQILPILAKCCNICKTETARRNRSRPEKPEAAKGEKGKPTEKKKRKTTYIILYITLVVIIHNIYNNIIHNLNYSIMYKIKSITLREKAAIIYSLITGVYDNVTFYSIAKGSENYINKDSYSNMGSKLKTKDHIKQYYTEAQNIIDNYITARIKQLQYNDNLDSSNNNGLLNGSVDSFTIKNINFTNPVEFIQYLNDQANNIQDEKTKREYLKMLADFLRFKGNGNSGQDSEIQHFYTPVTCKNCLLYNLKADEIGQK